MKLPPYRAMLAVDVKDFSARAGRRHHELTEAIPRMLGAAFDAAGIGEEWKNGRRFERSDGDGYVAGFRPRVLPFLINPLLPALEDVLTAQDARADFDAPVRMRLSIAVGPVTDPRDQTIASGSGLARIELHRLLNADPVRQLLERAGPSTHLAAIVSGRAFEDAVLTGYSGEDRDAFVAAPVAEKSYRGGAYLRVPKPSGSLLSDGFLPQRDGSGPEEPNGSAAGPTRTAIGSITGQVQTGDGDLIVGGRHLGRRRGRRRDDC